MTENVGKLITSEIKARKVIYYLTTEDDLQNIKSNSLLGDIFSLLASLTAGGIISVIITKATGVELPQSTTSVLGVILNVFIVSTVILAGFSVFFYTRSFRIIRSIKESGKIKSLKRDNSETIASNLAESQLEIINAVYWTPNAKIDVTEELRRRVVNNKLDEIASNEIQGDPDVGRRKKLTIKYSFDGTTVIKEFTEGERMILP